MQNHHHIHSYHPMAQPNLHILSQQLAEPVNQPMQTLVELGAAIASVHTKLAQQHEGFLTLQAQQYKKTRSIGCL